MVTYFMLPRKMTDPETGERRRTYDIAAYGSMYKEPIMVVRDVSTDGDLVFRMVRQFNEGQLSPTHLLDAITDMLA